MAVLEEVGARAAVADDAPLDAGEGAVEAGESSDDESSDDESSGESSGEESDGDGEEGDAPYCRVCASTEGLKKCGRCLGVYYCGAECQREDWMEHKPVCKPKVIKKKQGNHEYPMCPHCGNRPGPIVVFYVTALSTGSHLSEAACEKVYRRTLAHNPAFRSQQQREYDESHGVEGDGTCVGTTEYTPESHAMDAVTECAWTPPRGEGGEVLVQMILCHHSVCFGYELCTADNIVPLTLDTLLTRFRPLPIKILHPRARELTSQLRMREPQAATRTRLWVGLEEVEKEDIPEVFDPRKDDHMMRFIDGKEGFSHALREQVAHVGERLTSKQLMEQLDVFVTTHNMRVHLNLKQREQLAQGQRVDVPTVQKVE